MMKYGLFTILGFFLPGLSLAANPLDFTPPPDDLSIVFLGNIFGVVDGVLSGSGSQILGEMFGIFNAAVLAIGGIILLYVTIVSTLNTANEGEFLGKKWSSIWIPVRAVVGVALLIPKQSGYCLMQIFVMWIVVQGVGAADRVWNAALDYMDAGGMIITSTPFKEILEQDSPTINASGNLLLGQTCMNALYRFLETTRNKNIENGLCPSNVNNKSNVAWWCKPIPNFSNEVASDLMKNQQPGGRDIFAMDGGQKVIAMPNVDKAIYPEIHGICGSITVEEGNDGTFAQAQRLEQMRWVAATQAFLNLGSTAVKIIRNQLDRDNPLELGQAGKVQYWEDDQTGSGSPRSIFNDRKATNREARTWSAKNGSALLNGKEVIDSALTYNKILEPVWRAIMFSKQGNDSTFSKQFIKQAKTEGWILAGAYFYDLAKLNKKYNSSSMTVPEDKGLSVSFNMDDVTRNPELNELTRDQGQNRPAALTNLQLEQLKAILEGGKWTESIDNETVIRNIEGANSISGHLKQVQVMADTGSPYKGRGAPNFDTALNIDNYTQDLDIGIKLPDINIKLGFLNIVGHLLTALYNAMIKPLFSLFALAVKEMFVPLIDVLFGRPLMMIVTLFESALQASLAANANPISLLAGFGAALMTITVTMWLGGLFASTIIAAIAGPAAGGIIVAFIGIIPAFFSMLTSVFVAGTMLAFYLPLLPFIIFLFGALAWMIGVIESMVAAPIVALGVMHPEGHEAFGKSDNAIMLILNVFLRPSMMIIGFIAGIILSYVGLWMLNLAFDRVIMGAIDLTYDSASSVTAMSQAFVPAIAKVMMLLIYVTLVMTIIHKSFSLIHYVPDKVLRWLSGGLQEQLGSSMTEGSVQEAQGMARQLSGTGSQMVSAASKDNLEKAYKDNKEGGKGDKESQDQVDGGGGGSGGSGSGGSGSGGSGSGGSGSGGSGSAQVKPQLHTGKGSGS